MSVSACAAFVACVVEREGGWSLYRLSWPNGVEPEPELLRGALPPPAASASVDGALAVGFGAGIAVFPPEGPPSVRLTGCPLRGLGWLGASDAGRSLCLFFSAADGDGAVLASATDAEAVPLGAGVRLWATSPEGAAAALGESLLLLAPRGPPRAVEVRGAGEASALAVSARVAAVGWAGHVDVFCWESGLLASRRLLSSPCAALACKGLHVLVGTPAGAAAFCASEHWWHPVLGGGCAAAAFGPGAGKGFVLGVGERVVACVSRENCKAAIFSD